jgi:hypothetical protein
MEGITVRKLASIVVVAALASAPLPAGAAKKAKQQRVEGSVLLPAPFYGDTGSCFAGLHRRIFTLAGDQSNGVVGYAFDIDPATWNKNFVLEVVDSAQPADLDIYMYIRFPAVEEWPNDPVNAGTPVSVDYKTRAVGGEAGKVPEEAVRAIVCLYGGDQGTTGLDASFLYRAGKGVKLPKG